VPAHSTQHEWDSALNHLGLGGHEEGCSTQQKPIGTQKQAAERPLGWLKPATKRLRQTKKWPD
jgi:hypothetical protein